MVLFVVISHLSLGLGSVVADRALVRLLTGVNTDVLLQGALLGETLPAMLAAEILHAGVSLDVDPERGTAAEPLLTSWTLEGFAFLLRDVCMVLVEVLLEGVGVKEGLGALLTSGKKINAQALK